MSFFECRRGNPFIASAALDTEFAELGLRVERDQYIQKSKNREYGSFVNLYHLLAVRGQAMEKIQSANLKGIRLIELKTMLDGGHWPDGIQPLHLVWSHHVLPPTRSSLIDFHSKPVNPSEPGFTYPVDGCYLKGGPLASLEYGALEEDDFDIAITFENFGGKWGCYRRIVYSQRATELLQSIMKDLFLKAVINNGEHGEDGKASPAIS